MIDEETLWQKITDCQNLQFYTAAGLPFSYRVKVGKRGQLTKELLIDCREQSKTLTWSSIGTAYKKVLADAQAGKNGYYSKPKAIGDIRGISYIYPLLWPFGRIRVPEVVEEKMRRGAEPATLADSQSRGRDSV